MSYEPSSRGESGRSTIRFAVASVEESVGGHELLVFVDDVEMTTLGAGMGMDPADVLLPVNRLRATAVPTLVPIARCDCGVYGCGATDAVITRDGDLVRWRWEVERPIGIDPVFDAGAYDAEVSRIADDHSWERPVDTVSRLVAVGVDRELLARRGLALGWVALDPTSVGRITVAVTIDDAGTASHQAYLGFAAPGRSRTAQEVAREVLATLARAPQEWRATWSALRSGAPPPTVAGRPGRPATR